MGSLGLKVGENRGDTRYPRGPHFELSKVRCRVCSSSVGAALTGVERNMGQARVFTRQVGPLAGKLINLSACAKDHRVRVVVPLAKAITLALLVRIQVP